MFPWLQKPLHWSDVLDSTQAPVAGIGGEDLSRQWERGFFQLQSLDSRATRPDITWFSGSGELVCLENKRNRFVPQWQDIVLEWTEQMGLHRSRLLIKFRTFMQNYRFGWPLYSIILLCDRQVCFFFFILAWFVSCLQGYSQRESPETGSH